MNLAHEVSSMESELESLRAEMEVRKKHEEVILFENDQLRKALTKIESERDTHRRRADTIKAILDQTGAALVHSIQRFHDDERELVRPAMDMRPQPGNVGAQLPPERTKPVLAPVPYPS